MPETYDWYDVLVSLRRSIRATDLHTKQMVKSYGLTPPQIMVLGAIESLGDVTVKRISGTISLSQATVTTILNRLESRGLIERVRSRVDKRIVNARLTERGRQVLASAPPLLHEKFIACFNALAAWEQNQILAALQRVASMMDGDTLDAAPSPGNDPTARRKALSTDGDSL